MNIDLSPYQKDILYWVEAHAGLGDHLIGSGVAGCGKTFTAVEIFKLARSMGIGAAYIAFNKDIRLAVTPRLKPLGVASETYHSHGFRAIRNHFGGAQLNENKMLDFFKGNPRLTYLKWKAKKLVTLCKINGIIAPDDPTLEGLAYEFDVDFDNEKGEPNLAQMEITFKAVRDAINYSLENPTVVDFDDMLFIPFAMPEIAMPQYPLLVIDELQDTSPVQTELALRSIAEGGNIIGIGDRYQSIYAFRGAGSTSVDDFKKISQADELPLSLSYRCPLAVRDLINKRFPYIKFESPDWAIKGEVKDVSEAGLITKAAPGDLILCRVNADLVATAFDLLRANKRAVVRGRNFGEGVMGLVKKSRADSTKEFITWLDQWRDIEIQKADSRENEGKRQNVRDRYDTAVLMAEGTINVHEINARCSALFSDDETNKAIMLSSVHKAKGLEADNVYILRPDLMPHPAAWKPEDLDQENNIEYVAISRTKKGLYFVGGDGKKELPKKQLALPEPIIDARAEDVTPVRFQF